MAGVARVNAAISLVDIWRNLSRAIADLPNTASGWMYEIKARRHVNSVYLLALWRSDWRVRALLLVRVLLLCATLCWAVRCLRYGGRP